MNLQLNPISNLATIPAFTVRWWAEALRHTISLECPMGWGPNETARVQRCVALEWLTEAAPGGLRGFVWLVLAGLLRRLA